MQGTVPGLRRRRCFCAITSPVTGSVACVLVNWTACSANSLTGGRRGQPHARGQHRCLWLQANNVVGLRAQHQTRSRDENARLSLDGMQYVTFGF